MTMADWAKRLDIFLSADDRAILTDAGSITEGIVKAHAETELEKCRIIQAGCIRITSNGFWRL